MDRLFGLSKDAFIYDADTYKQIPIRIMPEAPIKPLCGINGNGLFFERITNNTIPMKHITYKSETGLLLGLRLTENTVVLLYDNHTNTIGSIEVKNLHIGDILYSDKDLFGSNKFILQSIIDIEPEDVVYTVRNTWALQETILVNGISIVLPKGE